MYTKAGQRPQAYRESEIIFASVLFPKCFAFETKVKKIGWQRDPSYHGLALW